MIADFIIMWGLKVILFWTGTYFLVEYLTNPEDNFSKRAWVACAMLSFGLSFLWAIVKG